MASILDGEEAWYAFAPRTGLPLVDEHPQMRATRTTFRQAERAMQKGRLRTIKPGQYRLASDSAIRAWLNGAPAEDD